MSPSAPLDIVYFSSVDWNFTWQRPQHLAARLACHGRLLYISPFGLRAAGIRDTGRIAQRVFFRARKPANTSACPGLTVHTPLVYVPRPESALATGVNARLLNRRIRQWMQRAGAHNPIVWTGTPSPIVLETIRALKPRLLVYDCLDNFAFFHSNREMIRETERQLASQAQIVLATSLDLYERMKTINPETYLVPNAVEYEHFQPRPRPAPPEMASIRKPILGYYGEIARWFDFDLVCELATQNPHWSIVLIGQIQTDEAQRLSALPNVYLMGRKEFRVLPEYLDCFDVCLIPFQINELTTAVNPIKLYEYLAAGKPVVSTPLPEVVRYSDVVTVATRANFAESVRNALAQANDPALLARRQAVARENTWDQRLDAILQLMGSAFNRQPVQRG